MAILVDLPSPLEEDLALEAARGRVSASEEAALLLQLMTALVRDGRNTPFRSVVKAYLREYSLDSDRLAEVFEGLIAACLQNDDPASMPPVTTTAGSKLLLGENEVQSLLRGWRSQEANRSIAHDVEVSFGELAPLERLVQRAGPMVRTSSLGKYAHLGLSSEAFIAEKRDETAHEDRGG